MKSKSIFLILVICVLFQMTSCKEPHDTIGSFKGLPSEIEGCSCYFSKNKKEFQLEKYICAEDYFHNAYIIINDKKIILKNVESGVSADGKDIHWTKTYKNENYQIKIEMFQTGEIDETSQQKGVLTLKNKKTGQEIKSEFYGECGC